MPTHKPSSTNRFLLLFFILALAACPLSGAEPPKISFDVPATTLENALKSLSRQSGVDVIVPSKIVRGVHSKPVKGEYTALGALEAMLEGTAFVAEQDAKTGALTVRSTTASLNAKKNGGAADASPGASAGNNDHDPRAQHPATPDAATSAPAQNVTITGRVFNVATGFYLKNAEVRLDGTANVVFTEDGGIYSITVPAGTVSLTASYASVQSATITLDATPGGRNTADFDLKPLVIGARPVPPVILPTGTVAAARAPTDREIVLLDPFVVTAERAGQAKAIMIQRAADNAVTAIATDNFGELTQGAVGEFLKYMPGVTIDYGEDEASTVRVGGLDPKYAGFALDGVAIASASSSRANFFTQMSITGIESIEFHQTLLARMPANTPAGRFELKSRYAFDRRRPELRYTIGLDGISDAIELGRSYMPDDKKHYRTYPGGQISWGGPFFNRRLGVDFSVSRYANYRDNQMHQIIHSYLAPDPELNPTTTFVERNGNLEMDEGPEIMRLQWRAGPRIWTASAASLSLDYRLTPDLTLTLRSQYSRTENEYYNIYYTMGGSESSASADHTGGPFQGIHPSSSLVRWIVNPIDSINGTTTIWQGNTYGIGQYTNYLVSPRLEYKKGPLQVNFRAARSNSRYDYRDADEGFFRTVYTRILGTGWEAVRSSVSSPVWTLTQTAGNDWTQPQNWNRGQGYSYNARSLAPDRITNIQDSAYLDLTCAMPVLGHPVTFRTGGGILKSDHTYRIQDRRYLYRGPEDYQQVTTLPFTQNYILNIDLGGKAGNINEQNWGVINQHELWRIYDEHPEWFSEDVNGNFRREFLSRRDLTERIDSAYFEATSRAGKFSFNAGMRFEHTGIKVLNSRMRPWEDIIAARDRATPEQVATGIFDFTTDTYGTPGDMVTNEGFLYRYYDGRRFPRRTDYNNFFFSGGFKYDFTKNLRFQLSASQAILRPDYTNLAGAMQYITYYVDSVWVPNPALKPEKTTKIYAGLQWYLTPAGLLSLSAYRLDIDGLQIQNMQISPEQAEAQLGYPLRSSVILGSDEGGDGLEEGGNINPDEVYYRSTINAKGVRTVYGVTLEYNQQLTFLPGYLKGLSVFGSVTTASMKNAEMDEEKIGRAAKSASGGIRYRYSRFNVQLRATWQDDALMSVTRPQPERRWFQYDHLYRKARIIVDLSGGYQLTRKMELSFSVRNITNSPDIWYSNVPGRLARYYVYGSTWNLSLKGSF